MGEVMSLAKGLPQVPLLTFGFINKMASEIDHLQHLQVWSYSNHTQYYHTLN